MERGRNGGLSLLRLLVVLSLIVVAIVFVVDNSLTLWETHAYYLPYKREVRLLEILGRLPEMLKTGDRLFYSLSSVKKTSSRRLPRWVRW